MADEPTGSTAVLLARLEGKIDLILARAGDDRLDIADHEQRVRSLERWRYGIPVAGVATVAATLSAVLT